MIPLKNEVIPPSWNYPQNIRGTLPIQLAPSERPPPDQQSSCPNLKLNQITCKIFGCTPTRCSLVINRQLHFLSRILKNNEKAQILWPNSLEEKEYLADLVHRREPKVSDVIGFTDGVSLPIQCTSDPISQATNYNGYHHDTMCNNVFCFASTGKIIFVLTFQDLDLTRLSSEPVPHCKSSGKHWCVQNLCGSRISSIR